MKRESEERPEGGASRSSPESLEDGKLLAVAEEEGDSVGSDQPVVSVYCDKRPTFILL
ncbi:hypothetical protein JOB18_038573 [Solea senegalensis]|uniref:Uncharacterized protein n=1 Tax=Solea senegalensis TaxID=28829 RepID=A0AAV6SUY3_SOLSE|nr:hypothetical protein JOB18_038573 [Solea senegalensis]